MKKLPQIPLGPAENCPGEILQEEFLIPLGLSLRELARQMGCGPARISEIVRGKRTITAETSILLGRALGVSPGFFLGLQFDYDLACAALRLSHQSPSSVAHLAAL
jgi:addiction module HigA family antidote